MRIFDVDQLEHEGDPGVGDGLPAGEAIEEAFRGAGTTILFTNRRIVTVQLQVVISERVETTSYSYRSIRQFSLVEGVAGAARSEIKIWFGVDAQPLHLRANPGTDFSRLHGLLVGRLQ
jgi:hypothetical protein